MAGEELAILFIARMIERVFIVLVGGLSVYLGYLLFKSIPERHADASEARFFLPGDISVHLSRIGPGVFFALFGAAIVIYSVGAPLSFYESTNPPEKEKRARVIDVEEEKKEIDGPKNISLTASYAAQNTSLKRYSKKRSDVLRDVGVLTELQKELQRAEPSSSFTLDEERRDLLKVTLPRVKRQLVISIWDVSAWDDKGGQPMRVEDFIEWDDSGAVSNPELHLHIPEEIVSRYSMEETP